MSSSHSAISTSEFDQVLAQAFRSALDLTPEEDVEVVAFEQHLHWDSLGHISLVLLLEEVFGVELDEEDVLAIDSYSAARTLLRSRRTNAS
jgi:acyl carrier protein